VAAAAADPDGCWATAMAQVVASGAAAVAHVAGAWAAGDNNEGGGVVDMACRVRAMVLDYVNLAHYY
jgi:hypothetical protein